MSSLSLQIIVESGRTLAATKGALDISVIDIVCVAIAIAVKSILFLYCKLLSRYPSAKGKAYFLLLVLAQDHMNDIIFNSTGIAFSIMGGHVAWWIDPVGAILIALLLLVSCKK